jgi:putative flippase GtrA
VSASAGESPARRDKPATIAGKYILFAAVATGCNLGSQALMDRAYRGPLAVYVSLAVGTLIGLVVKYVLDKRLIFYDETRGIVGRGWQFARYVATGVLTTAIFWGFELGAYHAFHSETARYVGGAIGLALGYWTKYQLDKRLVFLKGRGAEREGR